MSEFTKDIIFCIVKYSNLNELLNLCLCSKFYYQILMNEIDNRNEQIWKKCISISDIDFDNFKKKLSKQLERLNFKSWPPYQKCKLYRFYKHQFYQLNKMLIMKIDDDSNESIIIEDCVSKIEIDDKKIHSIISNIDNEIYFFKSSHTGKYFWNLPTSMTVAFINENDDTKEIDNIDNILLKYKNDYFSMDGFKCLIFKFKFDDKDFANYFKKIFIDTLAYFSMPETKKSFYCRLIINDEETFIHSFSPDKFENRNTYPSKSFIPIIVNVIVHKINRSFKTDLNDYGFDSNIIKENFPNIKL